MFNQFHFKLAKEKLPVYYMQNRAMHIMSSIFLVLYGLQYALHFMENVMMVLGVFVPAVFILVIAIFKPNVVRDTNNNRVFRIMEIGFIFMGSMYYLKVNQTIPALLFGVFACILLFLLWMEERILQDQFILFEPSLIEIELPLKTQKISWTQVQNVLLKNDYLTLQLKNSNAIQVKIISNFYGLEEDEFYKFCKMQIS